MTKRRRAVRTIASLVTASLVLASATAWAEDVETFREWITEGEAHAKFRYRLESVDQDSFDEEALATTLRTRLNLKTADLSGFGAFVELDWVVAVPFDDYDAGGGNTPDMGDYPVIADPEGIDFNQAYLQWKSGKGTLIRGGRERIIFDNARYVGNVGWRQNEQTYDAAYLQHKAGGFDLQLAYVAKVNRIFGRDVPAGQHDNSTWLFNGAKTFGGGGKLVAYYYDIDNRDSAAFSTKSTGLRYTGSHKFESFKLNYKAELARQKDAHNNAVDYTANYYRGDIELAWEKVTPYVGYESLGGDASRSGAAFRTPLATLHAFNGWADKFLTTPDAGLNDFFVGVKGKVGSWNWNAIYHNFEAESGSANWGREVDASIGRSFAERYSALFKAAVFRGASGSPYDDTVKVWIQLTADF